jgi:hypothetical protein
MLVVTTSVRMIDGVHSDSLHLREDLLESGVLVEEQTSLEDWLVITATSSDNSDSGSAAAQNCLTGSRGKSEPGLEAILGVTDNGGIGARGPREGALIAGFGLNITNGCSFGNLANGQDVTNGYGGLLATEYVLAGVSALSCQEVLVLVSIFVGVAELNLCEGCTSSGVMDNTLDDASYIAVPLRIVEGSVVRSGDSPRLVCLEDTLGLTLSLA